MFAAIMLQNCKGNIAYLHILASALLQMLNRPTTPLYVKGSIVMSELNPSSDGMQNAPQTAGRPFLLPDIPGLGGAIAGLIGGAAMTIVGAMLAASVDNDVWLGPRQIATMVYGQAALSDPGIGPIVVGTLLHLLISALLGAVFGIVSRRWLHLPSDYGMPVWIGVAYGIMIWLVAYFVVLPLVNPTLLTTYAPSFIIQNLVYGIVTGLVYTQLRPSPYARPDWERPLASAAK